LSKAHSLTVRRGKIPARHMMASRKMSISVFLAKSLISQCQMLIATGYLDAI
jgi:hypothetical protein